MTRIELFLIIESSYSQQLLYKVTPLAHSVRGPAIESKVVSEYPAEP